MHPIRFKGLMRDLGHVAVTLGSQDPAGALSLSTQALSQSLVDKIGPTHILGTASWGASSKKLLNLIPYTSANMLFSPANFTSDSDFVATIATLPGGSVLTYNDPTSGDETCIAPSSANDMAKIVLHNTTRATNALISTVAIATNTITLTATVPADWQVGDTITTRSQTNTNVEGACYYFDLDVSGTFGPTTAALLAEWQLYDTAANAYCRIHPYETFDSSKRFSLTEPVGGFYPTRHVFIKIVSQRFTIIWNASGSATILPSLRMAAYFEEAAT